MKEFNKSTIAYPAVCVKRLLNLLLGLVFLATVACETVIEVDLPEESPRLVVNSFIGTDAPVTVKLSQSKSILDNTRPPLVSGAEVVLLEEGEIVATLEEVPDPYEDNPVNQPNPDLKGFYTSSFIPSAGKNYTLQVTKSGYEPVEAKAYVLPPVPIQEVTYDTTVTAYYTIGEDSFLVRKIDFNEIQLSFTDPVDEQNYYQLRVLEYYMRYDYLIDEQGNYVLDEQGNNIIVDSIQLSSSASITSSDPLFTQDESFFGDNEEISSEAYGYSFTFTDDFINGKSYHLKFRPNSSYYHNEGYDPPYLVVSLYTISEAQYQYVTSNKLQYENEGDPFAEPVQVYNNIENGFGIFAGYSSDQVVLNLE